MAKSSKYTYRSTGGAGTADVSIEYSADLSALSRLEVSFWGDKKQKTKEKETIFFHFFFFQMTLTVGLLFY